MKLKNWQRNSLSVIIIIVGGFILWNVTFLLAALVMQVYRFLIGSFEQEGSAMAWKYAYLIVVLLISWFVFRTKRFNTIVKSTYLTMPLMVMLILAGVQFYQQPKWVPISVGALITLSVFLSLHKMKLSWHYYFASIYTAAMALYVVLADIQI